MPEMPLPDEWTAALDAASVAPRTIVLGATDVGKSSFIRAVLERSGKALLDLDPGQKMGGPPGSVALRDAAGRLGFVFIGTTSASAIGSIVRAGGRLAATAQGGFVANTSGFIRGLGARLQALTIENLTPDLIIAIEASQELGPILTQAGAAEVRRIGKSPHARRKSPSERRRVRQAAFDAALAGATSLSIPAALAVPGPPIPFEDSARPVCAVTDKQGEDMCLAILAGTPGEGLELLAPLPPRGVAAVKLGRMWAEPRAGGWTLIERRTPAWA